MNITLNKKNNINKSYLSVSILGKSLKLDIKYRNNPIVEIDEETNKLMLYLPKKYKTMNKINIINMAINKMYDKISREQIEDSLEIARLILGFAPEDYKIKRMPNDFYKYNKNKIITINPEIVKYSKEVIDTTLIQALCKMQYNANSKIYKESLLSGMKKYENYRLRIIKTQEQVIQDKAI